MINILAFSHLKVTTLSMKLKTKADATHTHLVVNHSLHYPAVTFCQEPPFRISNTGRLIDSPETKPKDMQELLHRWETATLNNHSNTEPFLEYIAPVTFSVDENIQEIKFDGSSQSKLRGTFTWKMKRKTENC